jgi:transposase
VSRNTVVRYLATDDVPRYKPRAPRPTKLDPCREYICQRMQAAAPDLIAASALLRELKAQGYKGQLRSLQTFMKLQKPIPEVVY